MIESVAKTTVRTLEACELVERRVHAHRRGERRHQCVRISSPLPEPDSDFQQVAGVRVSVTDNPRCCVLRIRRPGRDHRAAPVAAATIQPVSRGWAPLHGVHVPHGDRPPGCRRCSRSPRTKYAINSAALGQALRPVGQPDEEPEAVTAATVPAAGVDWSTCRPTGMRCPRRRRRRATTRTGGRPTPGTRPVSCRSGWREAMRARSTERRQRRRQSRAARLRDRRCRSAPGATGRPVRQLPPVLRDDWASSRSPTWARSPSTRRIPPRTPRAGPSTTTSCAGGSSGLPRQPVAEGSPTTPDRHGFAVIKLVQYARATTSAGPSRRRNRAAGSWP